MIQNFPSTVNQSVIQQNGPLSLLRQQNSLKSTDLTDQTTTGSTLVVGRYAKNSTLVKNRLRELKIGFNQSSRNNFCFLFYFIRETVMLDPRVTRSTLDYWRKKQQQHSNQKACSCQLQCPQEKPPLIRHMMFLSQENILISSTL